MSEKAALKIAKIIEDTVNIMEYIVGRPTMDITRWALKEKWRHIRSSEEGEAEFQVLNSEYVLIPNKENKHE